MKIPSENGSMSPVHVQSNDIVHVGLGSPAGAQGCRYRDTRISTDAGRRVRVAGGQRDQVWGEMFF